VELSDVSPKSHPISLKTIGLMIQQTTPLLHLLTSALQPGRSVGVPCVYMLVISLYQGEMANQGGTMIDRSLYVSTELVTVTRTCRTNFDSSQIDSMHACRAKVFYKGDMIMSVCSGGHSACPCQWSLQVQTEYYRLIFHLFHALKYDGQLLCHAFVST